MNKMNEENESVNEFVPQKNNTFSNMREYVEVTMFYKISLNSADQIIFKESNI